MSSILASLATVVMTVGALLYLFAQAAAQYEAGIGRVLAP